MRSSHIFHFTNFLCLSGVFILGKDWILDENKYYNEEELRLLLKTIRQIRDLGKFEGIRNWFMTEFDLNTGLRVEELERLTHGDIFIEQGQSSVLVRQGKGDKKRMVMISADCRHLCNHFQKWKLAWNLSISKDSPVFTKRNGKSITKRALQKAFSQCALKAGLSKKNIHCLRHTYATFLLSATGKIRFVQKQLGHSKITTTQTYAGLLASSFKDDLDKLDKVYRRL